MGLFSQTASKFQRPRGPSGSLEDKMPEDTEPDDTSILFVSPFSSLFPSPSSIHRHGLRTMFVYVADDETDVDCRDEQEGSIITSLISQLR